MPNIKGNKQDISKVIMPNKCDICTIGIGRSVLFEDKIWKIHNHIEVEVHPYYYYNGMVKVCKECFDELNSMKNPDFYIANQFIKIKRHEKK